MCLRSHERTSPEPILGRAVSRDDPHQNGGGEDNDTHDYYSTRVAQMRGDYNSTCCCLFDSNGVSRYVSADAVLDCASMAMIIMMIMYVLMMRVATRSAASLRSADNAPPERRCSAMCKYMFD
eukprot:TRINITY_DN2208_c0_g1_i1.p2 TRINITY_DN2208_c0_g1~~TRINITY_DN2208_c0_g1_i1.p2  ORF type:complete len:123 (-),score=9.06 TRINITY_DN2208_c0_g1_i1:68-436(-)